jgi:NodT family efflux transporter outer membrane factor (OMF) lipoprotein
MSCKNLLFLLPCLLAACAVGPDYVRPSVETPGTYKESGDWQHARPLDAIDRGAWWTVYNDPILSTLEDQVEISNQTLKAAEAAYRVAASVADETRATLFPSSSLNGSATSNGRGRTSPITQYNVNGGASWAPDVWGRIRRTVESDEANAEASAADLASARVSAQAALATDYFDLRIQDKLKQLLDDTVTADDKILTIVRNQYNAGIAAKADVLSAQTQLESVQAQSINAGVRRAQLEHAIAVLVGKPPSQLGLETVAFVTAVPNTPAEVPSTLLERRPDIASFERQMIAANAQIGVATAAWFPNIILSGSYGYTAVTLSKLLQASSNIWSVGPALAETIFDGGAREAALKQARATYDQTVAIYRNGVLTAFQQVEDNLSSLRILAEQAKAQDATVADARKATELTINQYKEGIVPYNNVLTAQTVALGNEQTALAVQSSRLDASVGLIQALGGGWDISQMLKDQEKAMNDGGPAANCPAWLDILCFLR